MAGMASGLGTPGRPYLSTLPAQAGDRRLALAVVIISVTIFIAATPFAKVRLAPVIAFIPIYQSALVVCDLITVILLFGQFAFLRSRALLVLASGYLFTGLMASMHLLTFPGLFSPSGLLGAGPQTTAWLYMFWHASFPLCVIAYSQLRSEPVSSRRAVRHAGLVSTVAVGVATGGLTLLATAGHDLLPPIMRGHNYTPLMILVVSSVWVVSLLALIVLWRRRPHSVLDLWLMVVICAWLFDIAMAAVLNGGRFDVGFYVGRIYGLLAASFVLGVLLIENGRLYFELDRQNRSLETTVRERTEQLLQSEKVATMGSLLAGVAHELNNPLAVVIGQAQLLRRPSATDPVVARQRAEKITVAAERCGRIVKNFLALARQRPPERGPVALNQVVQEAMELLAYELRTDNIEARLTLAEDLPSLWADSHQLHQVAINILANAHHALRRIPRPRQLSIATRAEEGQVRLEIADNGPGIPHEIRAKIFEPFFTTKGPREGTGLGLSLCRGIIDDHGGSITVDSEVGRGTIFAVMLPVVTRPSAVLDGSVAGEASPIAPKDILVVDDEPDLADAIVEELRRDGHRVAVASNGAEALRQLERQGFDLVLSDTKMPVMDGVQFYDHVVRRFPALRGRFIFVTGDALDVDKRRFLESIEAPYVIKPFDLNALRNLVRRHLADLAVSA
jgi:signal transduction histidine kinase